MNFSKKYLPELARIIGEITGDGHLQFSKGKSTISFYSKNLKKIKDFEKRFSKLFGIEGHIYIYTHGFRKKRYGVFFASKKVADALARFGTPVGNKTATKYDIPKWIAKGNEKIKSYFLRGLYDSEGSVYFTKIKENRKRWRIELSQYKAMTLKSAGKTYMDQVKRLVEDFGVKCSPVRFATIGRFRKDGSESISVRFDIENASFKKFYDKIGFDDKIKNAKLIRAIKYYAGVAQPG